MDSYYIRDVISNATATEYIKYINKIDCGLGFGCSELIIQGRNLAANASIFQISKELIADLKEVGA